jgi:hypothetical protein
LKLSKLTAPIVLALILATLQLGGCATESPAGTNESIAVRVVVSKDFGQQILLDRELEMPVGSSSMAALKQVAEVETAYGGGFVNSINGFSSEFTGGQEKQYDWLVYFNGIQSNAGALDYTMHHGDVQRWDFHHWNFRIFIPAIIGDFPEPFLHGYRGQVKPTVIVYDGGFEQNAEELEAALTSLGVADVTSQPISELSDNDKRNANLIIIGYSGSEMITELNGVWNRLGFFARFEDGGLSVYTGTGEKAAQYGPGTGIIQATQSPWNPKGTGVCENAVWMVSGTDEAGVEAAVEALVSRSNELQHAFAVVVTGGEIIRVP